MNRIHEEKVWSVHQTTLMVIHREYATSHGKAYKSSLHYSSFSPNSSSYTVDVAHEHCEMWVSPQYFQRVILLPCEKVNGESREVND